MVATMAILRLLGSSRALIHQPLAGPDRSPKRPNRRSRDVDPGNRPEEQQPGQLAGTDAVVLPLRAEDQTKMPRVSHHHFARADRQPLRARLARRRRPAHRVGATAGTIYRASTSALPARGRWWVAQAFEPVRRNTDERGCGTRSVPSARRDAEHRDEVTCPCMVTQAFRPVWLWFDFREASR